MEFWGVEFKPGQQLRIDLSDKVLHLSQVCIGRMKNKAENIFFRLYASIGNKEFVIGTLHSKNLPQQLLNVVFDKNFTLSHNWGYGSVFFYGHQVAKLTDENHASANGSVDAKQTVKIVESKKNKSIVSSDSEEDTSSSDSDSSSDADSDSDSDTPKSSSSFEDESDSEKDSDSDSSDDEKTKMQQSGTKRPNESTSKTLAMDKKTKTFGDQKSPASPAVGEHICKSCNRNLKTDGAPQSRK